MGILILAFVGGSSLLSKIKTARTYDDSAILATKANNGTLYFVSRNSFAHTEEGYSAAKIIVGLDRNSVPYFKKMVEAKLCGKDPHDVWGIEQDTQFDFVNRRYRVVASRVVDYKGEILVSCNDGDTCWTSMFGNLMCHNFLNNVFQGFGKDR